MWLLYASFIACGCNNLLNLHSKTPLWPSFGTTRNCKGRNSQNQIKKEPDVHVTDMSADAMGISSPD